MGRNRRLALMSLVGLAIIALAGCAAPPPPPPNTPVPPPPSATTSAPVPSPETATPTPSPDKPSLSVDEAAALIWSRLPDNLPGGYRKSEFNQTSRTARYEGNGKWTCRASGATQQATPLPLRKYEKTPGQWVEEQSEQVTRYTLELTAAFYEKTATVEVVGIDRSTPTVETRVISSKSLVARQIEVDWIAVNYGGQSFRAQGSFKNTGIIPLEKAEIEIALSNKDGKLLVTKRAPLTPSTIEPGGDGRFLIDFTVVGGETGGNYRYRFVTATGENIPFTRKP